MSTYIFELIHSNIWGPSSISDIGGSRYFIVFVDDYSRYSWILHMKHRSKLLQVYFNFAKMVEAKFSNRIKIFWSNNALEYTQHAFQAILHSYGTIHHLIYPGTSQQNGRAKWKFHHILDIVCALLLSAKVSAPFWGEAINRIPNTVIQNQTPYECLFGSPSNYHHIHSFNSAYFVLLQSHEHNERDPQSRLCCFLGYGETQKGYQCYDLVSHHFRISQNFFFWEHRFFVELFHFCASLSTYSILELFSNESHIPL